MVACGNCGKESPDGSAFCANCGAQLGREATAPPPPQYGQPYAVPTSKKLTPMWVGLIIGGAGFFCVCPVFLAAILLPIFASARWAAKSTVALSNAKQVAIATLMYANDCDDMFPPFKSSSEVADKIGPYLQSTTLKALSASYDWNRAISGVDEFKVVNPDKVWMFHSHEPDESSRFYVGFVDGHSHWEQKQQLAVITARPIKLSKEELLPGQSDASARPGGSK